MYCVKCKTSTDTLKPQYSITKNNKYIKKGQCKQCKSTKTSFVTQETAKKRWFLNHYSYFISWTCSSWFYCWRSECSCKCSQ